MIVFTTSPVAASITCSMPSESLRMRYKKSADQAMICLFKGVQIREKMLVCEDTTDLITSFGSPMDSTPFEIS